MSATKAKQIFVFPISLLLNNRFSLKADFKPYPQTSFLAAPEKARHVYRLLQAYYEDTVRLASVLAYPATDLSWRCHCQRRHLAPARAVLLNKLDYAAFAYLFHVWQMGCFKA